MKKIIAMLIAFILVCTCVFATSYTVTAGLGFGGFLHPEKGSMAYNVGPSAFAGFDYVNDNGLTIYDDFAVNLSMIEGNAAEYVYPFQSKNFVMIATEYAGLGYTFDAGSFSVMAGAGVEAKLAVVGAPFNFKDFVTIGAGLRCKGIYEIDKNWGVSFQLNASFDFKTIISDDLQLANELKFVSGNALIGATYTF